MKTRRNHVAVIAPSSRPLAESCRRAGFEPQAIDRFGDWDLRQCCGLACVSGLDDEEVIAQVRRLAEHELPILFGAGYERWAASVSREVPSARVLNASPAAVDWCRDPQRWCDELRGAGVQVPDWSFHDVLPKAGQPTLVKSRLGAGGGAVRRHAGAAQIAGDEFLQALVPGTPWSVAAIAGSGWSKVLGCFRQVIGAPEFFAPGPFVHCGNIGPIRLESPFESELNQLVELVTLRSGLVGLFGIDLIRNQESGRFTAIEINPRPTASLELLERVAGSSLFPLHVHACRGAMSSGFASAPSAGMAGKATVFHPGPDTGTVSEGLFRRWQTRWADGELADLPMPGTSIGPGMPLLTVFAVGADVETVWRELAGRAALVQREWASQATN